MNPQRESPLESEISDFAEILRTVDVMGIPVIVGGHAVGLWSRYYLWLGVTELAAFLPFRSKDLDLVGTMELLEKRGGCCARSREARFSEDWKSPNLEEGF
jgi:hypothetical protein